jgi:tetratricopeptide (TPR) repeat protein
VIAFLLAVVSATVFWPLPPENATMDQEKWISGFMLPTPVELNRPEVQAEILQQVQTFAKLHPKDHRGLHLVGLVYSELNQTAEAERFLRASMELDSQEIQVRHDLAELLLKSGKDDEALALLEEGKEAGRNRQDYVCLLADAQSRAGRVADAIETLDQGLAKFPNSYAAWKMVGSLCLQQKRYADAESSLRKALELNRSSPEASSALIQALTLQNKTQEAAEARKEMQSLAAEKTTSTNSFEVVHSQTFRRFAASSFRSLAFLHAQYNKMEVANKTLQRSLDIDPSDVSTRLQRASLLRKQGQVGQAIDEARVIVQLQPELFAHYTNLASLCMEAGNPYLAEITLRIAADRGIADGQSQLHLAKFLLMAKKSSEAVLPARKAHEELSSVESRSVLAAALEQSGQAAEAARLQSSVSPSKPLSKSRE